MSSMHLLTLRFRDNAQEKEFLSATQTRTRQQGQFACVVGMLVYLLHGVLDQWFVAPELFGQIWLVRAAALCVPILVLLLSLTSWFAPLTHVLLALVGAAAAAGLIGMQMHLPLESAPYYYPMMVVVTFYTYNFIGTRFIYALCVDLGMLLAYNLIFGLVLDYPVHTLMGHDFFIVSANLIGGSVGYLTERQRRLLYLREKELDAERNHHLHRSLHDGLTGLPNRELLYDRILQAELSATREKIRHCGLFLDLDGFKSINDVYGHKAGDQTLREVAKRLLSTVRASDTVARIGGDEFFVLAENIEDLSAARALAHKILAELCAPFVFLPEHTQLGASIGICPFPYEGMTVSDLIHRADEAMYRVKMSGKGNMAVADFPKTSDATSASWS
ncbi:GGDEF domain-containing protein [Rhodoferax sp. U11-2br]|uniref:GGDEF domain-containing protein n=1 Tax=Rhodoferax sp. U11-2br TaxID=2838878 RepID=UPI001BE7E051|nr:GGDEF domain-containing protein [Rhodoferax sp. U11-2br]MBT3066682.1 GGDEF domain-containing protein [Rhodoferax sp. U11-2br]